MTWFCSVLLLGDRPRAGLRPARGGERVWAKPDHFWYRKSVPGGHLWLTVDARHGVKDPLFDHQRLAIELNIRTGYEFTPLTLPFADPASRFVVKYDGSNAYVQEGAMAIEFVHDGHHWRCDLQIKWDWNKVPPTDYECLPSRRPRRHRRRLRVPAAGPPRTRWFTGRTLEAFVENHNVAVRPAGARRRERSSPRTARPAEAVSARLDPLVRRLARRSPRIASAPRSGSPTASAATSRSTSSSVAVDGHLSRDRRDPTPRASC